MRIKLTAMLALLCSGACLAAPNLPEFPPSLPHIYVYGMSVVPPQEKGWYVAVHTPHKIGITKLGKTKDATVVIEIQDFKLSPPAPDEDFAAMVKQGQSKDSDPQRFVVQVHDVSPSKQGGAVCARSHSVAEDKAAKTPTGETTDMVLEEFTLDCRHPDEPRLGINATYSLRYHAGDRDPQADQAAATLLDSVQFVPLKQQPAGTAGASP